jgi:exopolysaccharide production protein ExoZ
VQTEIQGALAFPRWLQELGAASYSIYLTHFLVISAMVATLRHVPASHAIPAWSLFVVGVPIALLPGFLLHWFVEDPILKKLTSLRSRDGSERATVRHDAAASTTMS